ncbi:CIR protein PIR protein [Plasmodium vinckei lentum]|uniref:CIR protein PIR protein n=1 Tax=Plasmodium vinckei lentum TaxID=138297 RepID=A0A6V7S1P8_PLAVN|nr:CIR protein PIR protein [Plasmodium vinckei lentum]
MFMDVCKIFLKVDILFEDGKLNLKRINNIKGPYMRNCPYDKASKKNQCKTDLEGIAALWLHLINELYKQPKNKRKRENNDSQYVEYAMMWLGYRLFQTDSYSSSTLSDFYNNHLMKSDVFNNYSKLILKKKHLKDANLYYMNRYYQLFQQISYITMKYSTNNSNVQGIKNDSTTFYNMYTSLYNGVNECDSYRSLLNNLKTEYENLKKYLISSNRNRRHVISALASNFKDLPSIKQPKKIVTVGFDCEKCKKVNSSAKEKKPKSAPKNTQPTQPETSAPSPPEPVPPPQQVSAPASTLSEKPESVKTKTETSLPSESSQKAEQPPPSSPQGENKSPLSPSSEQQSILPSGEPPSDSQSDPQRAASPEPQPSVLSTSQKGSPDSQDVSNAGAVQLPNQENPPKSSDSGQDNSSSQTKEQGGDVIDNPEQPQDGQQQIPGSKHETSSGAPENTSNDLGSQDDGKGGSDTEPKNPTTQHNDQSITQGDSLKQQEDSGSMQLQNIFNIFKNTFETLRSPFYNEYTEIGNRLYEKATSTLESVYDKSRKFASSTINYLNEHLNKALENVPPGKENELEPPPSLPEGTKSEPQNIQTPLPVDQSNDNPQTPPPTQKGDSLSSKQVNPSDSSSGKQPQSPVDPSSKTSSLNIEKGNTGINAEEKKPQLVSFIDISKGYNRPEIVVTVLLIPIILGIMYKYLSSGWGKEMKRKKNMKKVINSIGGKRTVQIIIKSVDTKKMKSQIINPVREEKKSLLNIYKLMQADPVPFINLFFLLIFFVYKRKLNYLEL